MNKKLLALLAQSKDGKLHMNELEIAEIRKITDIPMTEKDHKSHSRRVFS